MDRFEALDVSAWHEAGALIALPASHTNWAKARRVGVKMLFACSAIAIGVAATALRVPSVSGEYVLGARGVTNPIGAAGEVSDEVPAGYWPRLVSLLKSSSPIAGDDDLAIDTYV